jgi:hypothetical protein
MSFPLVALWLAIMFSLSAAHAWGSHGEIAGVMSRNGDFEPKVRVTKEGSSIIVRKIKPEERFDFISVSFVFLGADRPDSLNDMVIQWEKSPGRMGKEWPLMTHKDFNPSARNLTSSWQHSVSFKLIDKSGKRFHRDAGWQSLVRISLNGSALFMRPWPEAPGGQPSGLEDQDQPAVLPDPLQPRVGTPLEVPSKVSHSINDLADLKALPDRIRSLEERILRIENAVAMTQNSVAAAKEIFDTRKRWVYWGPLLAMILSVLFTTVSLYLTFTRLSRGPASRNMPMNNYGMSGFVSEQRFRRTM